MILTAPVGPGVVAVREPRRLAVHLDRGRGDSVAEPPVDEGLGRIEDRERFAAVAQVLELPLHQLPEDAAAPVARKDSHPGDAAHGQLAAGDRQSERE